MVKFLWAVASLMFVSALMLGLGSGPDPLPNRQGTVTRKPDLDWSYTWPKGSLSSDLPRRFDLASLVTFGASADSGVRFVINADRKDGIPNQGIFVDVTAGRVTLGRLEGTLAFTRGGVDVDLKPGVQHEIALKRRGALLAVSVDSSLALLGQDGSFSGGRSCIGTVGGTEVKLKPLRNQTELPGFVDDFMRSPDEPSPWKTHSGEWNVKALPTPSMSANAFSYWGRSARADEAAFATTGQTSWGRYTFKASLRGEADEQMGLVFGVGRKTSHVLFRWTARSVSDKGRRELVLVGADGAERIIAAGEGGYLPQQWYRIEAHLDFGRARLLVDGHALLEAECDAVASGAVGLWCRGEAGAIFDDIAVEPINYFNENLAAASDCAFGQSIWKARWDEIGGNWSSVESGLSGSSVEGDAKLLNGSGNWRSFSAEASAEFGKNGRGGLVANYRDESDHCLFGVEPTRAVLVRVLGSTRQVLAEKTLDGIRSAKLRLVSDRGYLGGYVDGKCVVEAWDNSCVAGRVGIYTAGSGRVVFDSFGAKLLPHVRPRMLRNAVFESDPKMMDWAGENADWYRGTNSTTTRNVYWHTAPFHGDAELALDLPRIADKKGTIVLGLSKSGDKPQNGYGWRLSPVKADGVDANASADAGWDLSLLREGVEVGKADLGPDEDVSSIFLRRQGGVILGGINGRSVSHFVDPDPLKGGRVAFLAQGIDAGPEHHRLYGGRIFDYMFSEAPAEWRAGSGKWQIANRWECDPRWSFLVGMIDEDSGDKSVVVWNKRKFEGDLVLDFFIGPKMNTKRGRRYEYARDFNVTIAADGKDVTSGYSFVFAGHNNTRSGIYRGSEALVETSDMVARIPRSMVIHQRWFHVRVQRTGNKLIYRVSFDGRNLVSLDCEDKDGLTGDRIALWSEDCGIVIARMRISTTSGEADAVKESPDMELPAPPRTIYDETDFVRDASGVGSKG